MVKRKDENPSSGLSTAKGVELFLHFANNPGRFFTSDELMGKFGRATQTIARWVDALIRQYPSMGLARKRIGKQSAYGMPKALALGRLEINQETMTYLLLCRAIVDKMLPVKTAKAIGKSLLDGRLDKQEQTSADFFKTLVKGRVKYEDCHHQFLGTFQQALMQRKLGEMDYLKEGGVKRHFLFAPMKILVKTEAIYLKVVALVEGQREFESIIRTLALHRVQSLRLAPFNLPFPTLDDSPETEEDNFGLEMSPPFNVRAQFFGGAAQYVKERRYSPDQVVKSLSRGGGVELAFTATSRVEVKSMIQSFGDKAKLFEPADLRQEIRLEATRVSEFYPLPKKGGGGKI